jgi:zinc protease
VRQFRLDNGLTVLVLPLAGSPVVAVSGKINAGDHFAEPARSQVPYLVAELLPKGSLKYTKESLADELENMGTSLEFSSGTFSTDFDTQVVKEDVERIMQVVADTILNPKFPPDELKLEKKLRVSDLKERMADTGDMSWNLMVRNLYKPTSSLYEKSFEDQIAELDTIKQKDLKDFHGRYYKPANSVIALVGDVTEQEARELCQKHFSTWTGDKKDAVIVRESDTIKLDGPREVIAELPDKANTDIIIGRTLPVDMTSKDYFACVLGNAALGYDSFACRLAPVRDKYGLTYGIHSSITDPTRPYSPWSIRLSVNPENIKRARDIVASIVSDYLKEGITSDELDTEKSHLSGVFAVQLRSCRHIAQRLTFYEIAGVGTSYIDDYPANLDKVTVEEVNRAIRSYFSLDKAVTAVSGTLERKQ